MRDILKLMQMNRLQRVEIRVNKIRLILLIRKRVLKDREINRK